mmetsp:Transcript_54617/g.95490  ORF Transcript_54617/g.95490 Transcript_54617/m.95490 type:complete len:362 (+) Transcript_54617:120-1205(+)
MQYKPLLSALQFLDITKFHSKTRPHASTRNLEDHQKRLASKGGKIQGPHKTQNRVEHQHNVIKDFGLFVEQPTAQKGLLAVELHQLEIHCDIPITGKQCGDHVQRNVPGPIQHAVRVGGRERAEENHQNTQKVSQSVVRVRPDHDGRVHHRHEGRKIMAFRSPLAEKAVNLRPRGAWETVVSPHTGFSLRQIAALGGRRISRRGCTLVLEVPPIAPTATTVASLGQGAQTGLRGRLADRQGQRTVIVIFVFNVIWIEVGAVAQWIFIVIIIFVKLVAIFEIAHCVLVVVLVGVNIGTTGGIGVTCLLGRAGACNSGVFLSAEVRQRDVRRPRVHFGFFIFGRIVHSCPVFLLNRLQRRLLN